MPKETKNRTTILSSNSIPGYISKENKNINSKGYMYSSVHSSTIYKIKICKQPKCPSIDEWIKKMCYIYMKVSVKVTQLCPTLYDPMDYTVHGILQARMLD